MTRNELLDLVLYLDGAITFNVDLSNKAIDFAYSAENLIGNNLSYEEFSYKYQEILELNNASREKLIRFLSNLVPSNTPFSLPADVVNKNGDPVKLIYKGYKYDKDHVIFVVTKTDYAHTDEIDQLTRTYTRNFIVKKISEAIAKNEQFTLMVLDIDNFKLFNDTYGHMFGDIVLVETAASIRKYLKNKGYIARIGGDEFMVMVYIDNEYDKIHEACSDLRRAISNLQGHNIKKETITATVGCASYPLDGNDYDTLFKKADKALYRGKRKGRNCFIIYTEERCGEITDDMISGSKTIDRMFDSANNYSIITGVFEILNRDNNLDKNIHDSLSLIGNFFVLDRISLLALNPSEDSIKKTYTWFQANTAEIYPCFTRDGVEAWRKALDKTGTLKIVQVESNKNLSVYKYLKEEGTSATLVIELRYKNRILGVIKYDMCSINKYWQTNDVASLQLIAKIFAIILNKEYENDLIEKELYFDKLTKVYNYTKWRNEIAGYLDINPEIEYSIMDINVKSLKSINEMYGTEIGDQVLKNIANSLKEIQTIKLLYCRLSGDKFYVFAQATDGDTLISIYNHIDKYIQNNLTINQKVTLNCGVYKNDNNDSLTDAIDKANIALKNCNSIRPFSFFSTELFDEHKRRIQLELHMEEALSNDEFLLYLQPKIDTNNREIVGVEALTRWNFKKEKILTPNFFIPLFEENGFITKLDYRVFENVCRFQRKVLDFGKIPVPISINVSRYQKNFNMYIDTIETIRKKYDIDPKYLEIEITEGMYLDNANIIADFMERLHSLGYTISMDDFGAGYSNLSSLANLNFDIIKLDKNFCANRNNEKESVILTFVMELANRLNMKVLCEGVETQEYAEFLRSIGCHLVQGFLFDRPLPEQDFWNKYVINLKNK